MIKLSIHLTSCKEIYARKLTDSDDGTRYGSLNFTDDLHSNATIFFNAEQEIDTVIENLEQIREHLKLGNKP